VTAPRGDDQRPVLARGSGDVMLTAHLALIKGLLEAEPAVSIFAVATDGPLAALGDLTQGQSAEVLRAHDLRILRVPSAERALQVALDAAGTSRCAVAGVSNQFLGLLRAPLSLAARRELPRDGAVVVVMDNAPASVPAACPVSAARELDLPCIVAASVTHLRDLVESAVLLSRAARRPAILVTHARLLDAVETMEARPNRIDDSIETMIARRWDRVRTPRGESADPIRLARRLELNRIVGLPSPGERVPLGFLTVGPARLALEHLLHAFNLVGRVPHLALGVAHPIDTAAVERLLQRCERVILLEARPGSSQSSVLGVAEMLHRRGAVCATVWSRSVPEAGSDGEELAILPDDALHPSRLARLLVRLLHTLRPAARIESLLAPPPPTVPSRGDPGPRVAEPEVGAALRELARMARRAERMMTDQVTGDGVVPPRFVIGGMMPPRDVTGRAIPVEIIGSRAFESAAAAMIRHAARERRGWIVLVADVGSSDGIDPLRLARAVIPSESAVRVRLEEASFSAPQELMQMLSEAGTADQALIVIVRDPEPARFRTEQQGHALEEIDRLGYEPRQRAIWSLERSCAVRSPVDVDARVEVTTSEAEPAGRSRLHLDGTEKPWYAPPSLRIRPLLEEVEVRRVRPPVRGRALPGPARLPMPEFAHRAAAIWRVHLAGCRGAQMGPVVTALLEGGRQMGYHVRAEFDRTPVGVGQFAWGQICYSRPSAGDFAAPPGTCRIPFGEADLLVGLDPAETLRALGADPDLRVAGPGRTAIIANISSRGGGTGGSFGAALRGALAAQIEAMSLAQLRMIGDFVQLSRYWFRTDRLVDMLLLGAAYQRGLIPLSIDAMEHGLRSAEAGGFGRLREAFDLGRRLVIEPAVMGFGRSDRTEDVHRSARRLERLLHRRGSRSARRAAAALERAMEAMPGLAETDAGRRALGDFLGGFSRAHVWGGARCAERFADRIVALYRSDRGETGRQLTRLAILPLAVATLILDPIFLASMATSAEHRRRTRQRLDVHPARGDELERRYVTRLELTLFGRRLRGVVRSSDWPSRIAWSLRDVLPIRLRGSSRERAIRDLIMDAVDHAAEGDASRYDHHLSVLSTLHDLVQIPRWRTVRVEEVRAITGGDRRRLPADGGSRRPADELPRE